jgi:hypothetical protein
LNINTDAVKKVHYVELLGFSFSISSLCSTIPHLWVLTGQFPCCMVMLLSRRMKVHWMSRRYSWLEQEKSAQGFTLVHHLSCLEFGFVQGNA